MSRKLLSVTGGLLAVLFSSLATQASQEVEAVPGEQSPDFSEGLPKSAPVESLVGPNAVGPIAPAEAPVVGTLSGRVVYTSGGHGWTYNNDPDSSLNGGWLTQRGVNNEICEDFGNVDQMNLFAYYCFNAGATVVAFRPIGNQTNEVVLDNDAAAVTFSGTWLNSTSTIFFGSSGDLPYRFANLAATETATATYTPTIPVTGFYPVYTWVRHGSDRTSQLYRIRHTGGEAQVRVPHYLVGNGWIYLGTYYFNAGSNAASGAVLISNLQPTPSIGGVVIADAIRFGNGMGNVVPTPKTTEVPTVSGYPREEECSRYWVQRSLGQGQPASLYNTSSSDLDDNVGAPPRMAAEMNSTSTVTNLYRRVYIGFHSNAGGGRGPIGLVRSDAEKTPNQAQLATLLAKEIDDDLNVVGTSPPLEVAWDSNRAGYTGSGIYGEINNSVINGEMDATIIEVGFHDQLQDSLILRDPKARNWIARAVYHGVIRYMNTLDAAEPVPLTFLPEPPINVRALATTNGISIAWSAPVNHGGSGAASGYLVYRSTDGYGFGNPVGLAGAGATSLLITNLSADTDYYFRVAATNAAGHSFPSETVACRRNSNPAAKRILIVNAFDRFDRSTALRQTPSALNYDPPDNNGTMVRILPRTINSFDYVVAHGKSIAAFGLGFDSCQRQAITNNQVLLSNYGIVIWAAGQSLTNTFRTLEQTRLSTYLTNGGHLFVSGSKIAFDLDRATGPAAAERNFLKNQLHADLASDANTNSASYNFSAVTNGIFQGNANGIIDDGSRGIYWVQSPEVLTPFGAGASAAILYTANTNGAAAIQYDGSMGGGRVVYFGFPFETISLAARRDAYMADILNFFTIPVSPTVVTSPVSQAVPLGSNVLFSVVAAGSATLRYQWRFNEVNLAGATNNVYTRSNVQPAHAGDYSVVVTNDSGAVTSALATLTVIVPRSRFTSITPQGADQVKLTLTNAPGLSLTILSSSNLLDWATATNFPSSGGLIECVLPQDGPMRFYRAVWP